HPVHDTAHRSSDDCHEETPTPTESTGGLFPETSASVEALREARQEVVGEEARVSLLPAGDVYSGDGSGVLRLSWSDHEGRRHSVEECGASADSRQVDFSGGKSAAPFSPCRED